VELREPAQQHARLVARLRKARREAEALEATGRQTQRERKLPAPFTVWLVIAMAFYRNLSIQNILNRMGNVLGVGSLWTGGLEPTSPSAAEARDRVGFGPMRLLVEKFRLWILERYREAMSWKGMLLVALDGTTFKVPDSEENGGVARELKPFPRGRLGAEMEEGGVEPVGDHVDLLGHGAEVPEDPRVCLRDRNGRGTRRQDLPDPTSPTRVSERQPVDVEPVPRHDDRDAPLTRRPDRQPTGRKQEMAMDQVERPAVQ